MKYTLMLLALLSLSLFQVVFGLTSLAQGRQDPEGSDITEALDYALSKWRLTESTFLTKYQCTLPFLVPGFVICNTDTSDGGLTLEELHADICQEFIASVGDSDAAEYNFEMFDSNADGVVTLKEFLDLADTLINM